ncbi:MAG: DMT family transporter [Eubacterium sp.]|nr:DMT family transporter [Eubacterium sp.]
MEKKNSLGYSMLLLLAAFIWGSAFVAQSVGMEHIGPFTFSAVRNTIGFLVLIPVSVIASRSSRARQVRNGTGENLAEALEKAGSASTHRFGISKQTLIGGLVCGVVLCASSNFQQCGMVYTTVGKSGFITALYVVFVPVFGIFLKKKTTWRTWFSVLLAVIGLYLLCMTGTDLTVNYGDGLMLICAILFAVHILVVDRFIDGADGVTMSCIQFGVTAVISTVLMFVFEEPRISDITTAWLPILYAGVLSSGVAFTLQIITQRHLTPVVAALIMSMESVFSVLSGWVVLGEWMSTRELIGCILMFVAIILAQLPGRKK